MQSPAVVTLLALPGTLYSRPILADVEIQELGELSGVVIEYSQIPLQPTNVSV